MAWRFLQCAHAPAGEAQKVNLPVTFSPLTRSILQSIAAGHTLAETATHLQLPLPTLRQHLRAAYDQFALPRVLLTQREVQTLRFLNQGLLYKECAVAMGISEVTVKSHMQNAGDKLLPEKSGSHSVPKTLFAARAQGILV